MGALGGTGFRDQTADLHTAHMYRHLLPHNQGRVAADIRQLFLPAADADLFIDFPVPLPAKGAVGKFVVAKFRPICGGGGKIGEHANEKNVQKRN